MPTNPNMVAIQTVTVGAGGASSIEFTSIPQTYTDLKVVFSVRDATNNNGVVKITFNGSATGYTARQLYGTGSSAASNTDYTGSGTYYGTEGSSAPSNATASTFSNCELYIPNYTSSNNKSISADSLYENNATLAYQSLSAGLWSNSAAITSIKIAQFSGNNFAQYSTATLYGVTSAGYGAKATGGIITQDANYYYHTFLASGTFTPTQNLTADYLVVAGGGGGGGRRGAGGGAGGLRCTVTATGGGGSLESAVSLTNGTAYTVTIGGGGTGGVGDTGVYLGNNGSNSSISGSGLTTITSTGGGGGGGDGSTGGSAGGSGGGNSVGTGSGGAGTANQGYAGGSAVNTAPNYGGGGGGGAGAVGANGTSTTGGNGGNGVATSISGSSVTYAGGGGGSVYLGGTAGNAGTGGGGAGAAANTTTVNNGTTNTGGGGGGGGFSGSTGGFGGAGGSGIVIVRYAK